jgi:hypothetical protein
MRSSRPTVRPYTWPSTRWDTPVSNVLDTLPFDYSHPAAPELRDLLAELYYRDDLIARLADGIGFPRSEIPYRDNATATWHEFLREARNRDVLTNLVIHILDDDRARAQHERIRELIGDDPVVARPTPAPTGVVDSAALSVLERQTADRPTFLGIAFLEAGLLAARAVARLTVYVGNRPFWATGFRIGDDFVLTNHHVLFDRDEPAARVLIDFNYENSWAGEARRPVQLDGDPGSIQGNRRHDWAVVRTREAIPEAFPALPLGARTSVGPRDGVCIVQHPSGGAKQVALHHNTVIHVNDNVVRYLTDTAEGSSGSPVFDHRWEVVALHRAGTRLVARFGGWRAFNEGTRIERVIDGLTIAGIPFNGS